MYKKLEKRIKEKQLVREATIYRIGQWPVRSRIQPLLCGFAQDEFVMLTSSFDHSGSLLITELLSDSPKISLNVRMMQVFIFVLVFFAYEVISQFASLIIFAGKCFSIILF